MDRPARRAVVTKAIGTALHSVVSYEFRTPPSIPRSPVCRRVLLYWRPALGIYVLTVRPELAAIFEGLVPYFADRTQTWKPWWWPKGPGADAPDWGLVTPPAGVFESLNAGAPHPGKRALRYEAFAGSVSAGSGCVWLLSSRPSTGTFAGSVGPLYGALVNEAAGGEGIVEMHVTDLAKFRGPDDRDTGMDERLYRRSVECLLREYEATKPSLILITKLALAKLTRSKSVLSDARRSWAADKGTSPFNEFLVMLESCGRRVPHWKSPDFSAAMTRELRDAKKRISF